MKIGRNEVDRVYNAPISDNTGYNKKAKSETAEIKDEVVLSDKAREYSAMNLINNAVIDEVSRKASPEKLLRLKNEVASGTYHVSSDEIADAILGAKKSV